MVRLFEFLLIPHFLLLSVVSQCNLNVRLLRFHISLKKNSLYLYSQETKQRHPPKKNQKETNIPPKILLVIIDKGTQFSGFPGVSVVKNLPANAGLGFDPCVGKIHGQKK